MSNVTAYSLGGLAFIILGAYKGDNQLLALGVVIGALANLSREIIKAVKEKGL